MSPISEDEKTALWVILHSEPMVHTVAMYAISDALGGFAPLARAAHALLGIRERGLATVANVVSPYVLTPEGELMLGSVTP